MANETPITSIYQFHVICDSATLSLEENDPDIEWPAMNFVDWSAIKANWILECFERLAELEFEPKTPDYLAITRSVTQGTAADDSDDAYRLGSTTFDL